MQHVNSKKAQIVIKLLAEIFREERLKQNKSQRLLADEFDIHKSMISRIENGANEPKIISLMSVCDALGINLSDLFKILEDRLPKDFSLIDQ